MKIVYDCLKGLHAVRIVHLRLSFQCEKFDQMSPMSLEGNVLECVVELASGGSTTNKATPCTTCLFTRLERV